MGGSISGAGILTGPDGSLTHQLYAEGVATPAAVRLVEDEFKRAFKGMNSKHFKIEMKDNFDTANEPMPMVEPDDMVIVASPCHFYEPIKVPETESGLFHCLVRGHAFAI